MKSKKKGVVPPLPGKEALEPFIQVVDMPPLPARTSAKFYMQVMAMYGETIPELRAEIDLLLTEGALSEEDLVEITEELDRETV